MKNKNNILPPEQGSAGGGETAILFGKLDSLNTLVGEIMNDPQVRRMALEVGIVLLAKKYPALSVLLGAFGDTGTKHAAKPVAGRRPIPAKKNGRGI